jgi:kinesin family protein C2/C3
MRATKAETALSNIQSTYNSVVEERDQLRNENGKLVNATKEIAELRTRAEQCDALEAQIQAKDQELTLLQEQFKKETDLRKKYKNELEDLKGAVRVYARCRPMARYEIERGCKNVVTIRDETSLKLLTSRGERDFEFDAVFSATSTQEQVFEDTKRLVESCLDGFNVCVFAYGQTGSGKTFTMTGAPGMPGLTPKAVEELFRLINEKAHLRCKVSTYFVELYNDNLVDLYYVVDNEGVKGMQADPPKLDIKLDAKKMVSIRNSVVKETNSPAELMDLFNRGNAKRHTGGTKMNAESSRSHSIFAIMVESYDTTTKRTNIGKLSLVDLAGSERQDKTGAEKERLKEAQSINKSLLALGDVIAALSEGNAKFIPYRNNKLTQLMQDSLGGNAKTLMFVNFSPADYNCDETYTSLQYAAKVKKIVNNASKQAESEEVARLKAIIKRLQSGQVVPVDLDDGGQIEPEPPVAEDEEGKVYDGY